MAEQSFAGAKKDTPTIKKKTILDFWGQKPSTSVTSGQNNQPKTESRSKEVVSNEETPTVSNTESAEPNPETGHVSIATKPSKEEHPAISSAQTGLQPTTDSASGETSVPSMAVLPSKPIVLKKQKARSFIPPAEMAHNEAVAKSCINEAGPKARAKKGAVPRTKKNTARPPKPRATPRETKVKEAEKVQKTLNGDPLEAEVPKGKRVYKHREPKPKKPKKERKPKNERTSKLLVDIPKSQSQISASNGAKEGKKYTECIKTGQANAEQAQQKASINKVLREPEMVKMIANQTIARAITMAKAGNKTHLLKAMENPEVNDKISRLISIGHVPVLAAIVPAHSGLRVEEKRCPLMNDLNPEIRSAIWTLVVVRPRTFVVPGTPTGSQQPDLSMVSRTVREEVLPIFYTQNTFGIEWKAPAKEEGSGVNVKDTTTAMPVEKWARELQVGNPLKEGGWFGEICNWSFNYLWTPTAASPPKTTPRESKDFFISLRIKRNEGLLSADVEIHRHGLCMLANPKMHEACRVMSSPAWLNEAVINMLQGDSEHEGLKGRIRAEPMLKLVAMVAAKTEDLMEFRCKEVGQPVSADEAEVVPKAEEQPDAVVPLSVVSSLPKAT